MLPPVWFIESAVLPVPEPVVLPVESILFMLLVEEPVVPVEFIVPDPVVPDVVAAPVALPVPVVLALYVSSAAWTAANTLAMEKAAAAVVIIALDAFMINLLKLRYVKCRLAYDMLSLNFCFKVAVRLPQDLCKTCPPNKSTCTDRKRPVTGLM